MGPLPFMAFLLGYINDGCELYLLSGMILQVWRGNTLDGSFRNPAVAPVEVGTLSSIIYFQGFSRTMPGCLGMGFLNHQQYGTFLLGILRIPPGEDST